MESKLQNPDAYSFSTELFGSIDAVRKKNAESVKICEEMTNMLRARAAAEEDYAKALQKIANQATVLASVGGGEAESTVINAFQAYRADLLNKSVQHSHLASALLAEVCEPMQQIRTQVATQSKELGDRMGAITKTLKGHHNNYITTHQKFEKAYQASVSTACKIMDAGGVPPKVDPFLVYQKYGLDKAKVEQQQQQQGAALPGSPAITNSTPGPTTSGGNNRNNSPTASITARLPPAPPAPSLIHSVARTDLTAWLLPTDSVRLEELLVTNRQQLEYAELTRFACRDQWEILQKHTREIIHAIQVVLSEYQMLEERQVDETTTVIRKAIVHESSSLANQQYDVQMVFKQLESINVDKDLANFIEVHRTPFPGVDLRSLLENLAVTNSPLPIPPPSFPNNNADDNNSSPEDSEQLPIIKPGQFDHEMEDPLRKVAPASLILRLLLAHGANTPSSNGVGWTCTMPGPWAITITPRAIIDNLSSSLSNAVVVGRNSFSHSLPHFPTSLSRSSSSSQPPAMEQPSPQPLASPPQDQQEEQQPDPTVEIASVQQPPTGDQAAVDEQQQQPSGRQPEENGEE